MSNSMMCKKDEKYNEVMKKDNNTKNGNGAPVIVVNSQAEKDLIDRV